MQEQLRLVISCLDIQNYCRLSQAAGVNNVLRERTYRALSESLQSQLQNQIMRNFGIRVHNLTVGFHTVRRN